MSDNQHLSRRVMVKSTVAGVLAVAVPNLIFGRSILPSVERMESNPATNPRYPAIEESIVAEVVGVSHFDLDRLKVLVNARPELARATWDWGFGDWETALGAASHTGRKDIAAYLLSMGARPDIFTFAMLGNYQAVKSCIEFSPGVQRIAGPHGISLLQHAKNGSLNGKSADTDRLIDYLTQLGDADAPQYPVLDEAEKLQYTGEYQYGEKATDAFSVKINSRKKLLFGKAGNSGGGLLKAAENKFIYNGVPSVEISFQRVNGNIVSLTVKEPDLILVAKKL